jgi:hypothetical protein
LIDIGADDTCASTSEQQGDCFSNAAASACDDRDLIIEPKDS